MLRDRAVKIFLNSSFRVDKDGCWNWKKSCNKGGYGRIVLKDKAKRNHLFLTHRLSFEINVGEIPEGKHVLHNCDNPACCNPEHFRLGTPKQNAEDRVAKNRQGRNWKVLNLKQIRYEISLGKSLLAIADEHRAHWTTIYKIKKKFKQYLKEQGVAS